MIITIDGPAGSGKSTLAGMLANKIGFTHFNSGSLFRGVTAFLYENNIDIANLKPSDSLPNFEISVKIIGDNQHVFVNNKDYFSELRKNHISNLVPYVAKHSLCRQIIDNCQKEFCSKNNVVVEGRDVGSFVFPNAEIKFYLDCSLEERAKRRFLDLQKNNTNITLNEIKSQLEERDMIDRTRPIAPLVIPKNAIIIDSTNLKPDEICKKMHQFVIKQNSTIV